jgi:hypothetical protein
MQNATQLLPTKTSGREEKTEIQTLSCKAAAKNETRTPSPRPPTDQNEEHYHKKEKKRGYQGES